MKKVIALTLATVMLFAVTVNVCAAGLSLKGSKGSPTLLLNGKSATCIVSINEADKWIDVTMELWQGSTLLKTWTKAKVGNVAMNMKYNGIQAGKTYTLKVYGTIDGVAFPAATNSRTA